MSKPISVIVPVYNTEEFLHRCVRSIITQTYSNIEIILVDDGSTDKSPEICLHYANIDCRVRLIEKENGGLSSARNAGIEIAKGEYIAFVDSDDYIHRDFLQVLFRECERSQSGLAMCGRVVTDGYTQTEMFVLNGVEKWTAKTAVERLLTWNNIDGSVCDKLFHRSLFVQRRFPISRISEDLPVLVNMLLEMEHIVHVGRPLYFYCRRATSITQSGFRSEKMSVLMSSNEVRTSVIKKYPDLSRKADYYHFRHLLFFRAVIAGYQKEFESEKRLISEEVRNNFFQIIRNPYLSLRHKIGAVASVLGLIELFPYKRRWGASKHQ